jgi:hypothetical protein
MEQQTGAASTIPLCQADSHDFQEAPRQEYRPKQRLVIDDLEKQMIEHDREFAAAVGKLKASFRFSDSEVDVFLRSHRALVSILQESVTHLKASFDDFTPLALEVMSEDGPPQIVYALAMWKGDAKQAREALCNFDRKWWLVNSRKSGGKIVFDYQLV